MRGAAKAHAQQKNAEKQAKLKAGVSTKGVDVASANAKAVADRAREEACGQGGGREAEGGEGGCGEEKARARGQG